MMVLLIITATFIIINLLYPLWLRKQKVVSLNEATNNDINSISIVYLSQNYAKGIREKIPKLLDELTCFENSELIVIDDASTDETVELLKSNAHHKLRYVSKETPLGIPHSMNLGVQLSNYQNIVFCDQRQTLDNGIIKKLVSPLKHDGVGMVSSCISSFDKKHRFYLLRAYENYIKKQEGQTGNLIGVYGPLYALKKDCYFEIPDNIILDDLYLTLRVLPSQKVLFKIDCEAVDDNFELLYNYNRSKRYLAGLIQILHQKHLLTSLSSKQKTMLFWHKFLRIPIPLLLVFSYFYLGLESFYSHFSLLLFLTFSILLISLMFPVNGKFFRQMRSVLRLIVFYSFACIELTFKSLILKKNIYEK